MTTYPCPLCGADLRLRARKNDPDQYFWGCSRFSEGCPFICDDVDGTPFLKRCPECNEILRRLISKKTGNPFVACFNKDAHASKDILFFENDGSPRKNPQSAGIFTCPECGKNLLYRPIRKGALAGKKNIFLCPNAEGHAEKKTLFFQDRDGTPIL